VRERTARFAAVAVALALVAGCAASVAMPSEPASRLAAGKPPVPRDCVFETCRMLVGDSAFAVDVPARWNGTLLLRVPGFTQVTAGHTGKARPPGPSRLSGAAKQLFDEGYAVATATYAWGGWSVRQSLVAAEVAYQYVRQHVGVPQRVYAWGPSMGGLVSVLLAERHPDWVTGAAPTCGVLAGTVRFFDLALDAVFAVHVLLAPGLPIGGYPSYQAALAAYSAGRQAVLRASRGDQRQQALVLLIADLLRAAPEPGTLAVPYQVHSAAEVIGSVLRFSTLARWELVGSYGGEFSTNRDVNYASRLDAAERDALQRLAPGVAEEALGRLAAGGRVAADPAVRAEVARQLDLTGAIRQPVVTLHNALDPVAVLEHEAAYSALVAGRGSTGDLLQLTAVPPPQWTGTGALPPQGVGHCRFTPGEQAGVIEVLDEWVTTGIRPGPTAIWRAFGGDAGLRLGYALPPWPGDR
jgi:pimeloyl-ACP methyl ester carboxylesterase